MLYGDVDGDGLITSNDVDLLNELMGASLNASPPLNFTANGINTINTYTSYVSPFVANALSPMNFQILDKFNNVWQSASDGYIPVVVNGGYAKFTSASTPFNAPPFFNSIDGYAFGADGYKLLITSAPNQADIGLFTINGFDGYDAHTLDISKLYYPSSDTFLQILRADIYGDGYVDNRDGYALSQYVLNAPAISGDTFPPTQYPSTLIGTQFQALRITIEPFIDNLDDYPATIANSLPYCIQFKIFS